MQERRVLITGAGRGIGREIALRFAAAGATVVVSSRTQSELEAVADEIEAAGGAAHAITCDVTDPGQVSRLAATVRERMDRTDVLVNNAGAVGSHKFLTHPDELWHKMLAVNLTSVYYVTKAFAGDMVEQGWGRIINVASVASKVGGKYIAAYTASKHGVLGLTRALAVELAPTVTVNAICPSYVDTPMTDASIANIMEKTGMTAGEARAALVEGSVQGRLIRPEEVAALAFYLAQEEAQGITGQAINVDGGTVMY